jgi:large subunit ribosomal protein L10
MINLEQKKKIVASLAEKFTGIDSFYLVDFTAMSVASMINFRRELSKQGIGFKVAKNTLITRALNETGNMNLPEDALAGQTAIIFPGEDAVAPAKLIKQQFDKFQKPVFKGAVLEGVFYDKKQLNVLASLPGKKELIASILGSLNAPVSGILGAINAVMRDLASVIEEVAKQKAA